MKNLIAALLTLSIATSGMAQKFTTKIGQVSFFSGTALEDISAVNKQALSAVDLSKGEVAFVVQIRGFEFEKALMQEHFNENYMHSDKFPRATFNGSFQKAAPLTWPGSHQVELLGKLEIHGVSKEIRVPATLAVKGEEAQLNLKFSIKLADYGIKNDKVKNISETIEITVKTSMKKS
jgi:polyisoprenoid-binding protein YceI